MFHNSKFRHVTGKICKRELWYPDLSPSRADNAHTIAASKNHLCVVWTTRGGASIGTLPLDKVGKRSTNDLHQIHAHSAQIYDLSFHPYDDDVLASCGDDALVKLFKLPSEGLTASTSESLAELAGHKRRVQSIAWHPSAEGVLFSASADKTVQVWDVEKKTSKVTLNLEGNPYDIAVGVNGMRLAVTTNEKKIHLWDVREKQCVSSAESHVGTKPSKVIWLGDTDKVLTTGFTKFRERQIALWDPRNMSTKLAGNNLDSSSGVISPFYDPDAQLVFLAGRGDGGVRVLDMSRTSKPFYNELKSVMHDSPQQDACLLPKRALDIMDCEVDRMLKIVGNNVVPVSFAVPRKNKAKFADDLFPDTAGGFGCKADEYFDEGKVSKPTLVSLDPAFSSSSSSSSTTKPTTKASSSINTSSGSSLGVKKEEKKLSTYDMLNPEAPEPVLYAQVTTITRKTADPDDLYVPKDVKVVRSSKYRHIRCKPFKKEMAYDNLKVDTSMSDFCSLRANRTYFAIPWAGPGGRICVVNRDRRGKVPDMPGMLESSAELMDFDFNPFKDNCIASGHDDAHVRVWNVPTGLLDMAQNHSSPDVDMKGHSRRLISLQFHPTVGSVITTTAHDLSLRTWDIEQGAELTTFRDCFEDLPQHFTYNYTGSVIAASSRDKSIRLFDPRSSSVTNTFQAHDGIKSTRVQWLGNSDRVFSVGFSRSSTREFCIWDVRNVGSPLCRKMMDASPGPLNPMYDEDTGVMFLAGKGDGSIAYYELVDHDPYAHFLSKYQTAKPQVEIAPLPKLDCNVKEVEIRHMLKLTVDNVEELVFSVPRTRKEFFQDDIFPDTRDANPSATSAQAWKDGADAPPSLVSLRPNGMELLSNAPEIKREQKYYFDPRKEAEEEVDLQEAVMDKFYKQMEDRRLGEDDKLPQEMNEGVDSDEWDDYDDDDYENFDDYSGW